MALVSLHRELSWEEGNVLRHAPKNLECGGMGVAWGLDSALASCSVCDLHSFLRFPSFACEKEGSNEETPGGLMCGGLSISGNFWDL